MSLSNSSTSFSGELKPRLIRASRPHKARTLRTPFGRIIVTRDKGESFALSNEYFQTNLCALHRDGDNSLIGEYDLGSGLVTNVGTLALSNDFAWPTTAATIALNTLRITNNHATGTGATAAAITDIKLQTPSTQGGQTMVAGVQSFVTPATLGTAAQAYKTIATISYTGTEAVTEWGLFGNLGAIGGTALSSATGSPFTAGTATSGTVTGTPLTASGNGTQGQTLTVAEDTNGTRADWGLVTANTTSVVTVPAWYTTAAGATGSAPVNADTMVFRPVMWDHKVFAAINVNSGDSIQFTYTLTIASGG